MRARNRGKRSKRSMILSKSSADRSDRIFDNTALNFGDSEGALWGRLVLRRTKVGVELRDEKYKRPYPDESAKS
jgi:hypothetical protein